MTKKPILAAKKAAVSKARTVSRSTASEFQTTTASAAQGDEIRFYRANEKPYGVFSNLFQRPVEFEGHTYATSEHAYQAGKAAKPAVRDWILSAPTPSLAAMAAHGLYVWDVVPNWADIKFDRMRAVLRAKFEQHPDLKALLISTGEARLVEAGTVNNAVNRLWGEVDGKGQNMLGVMLMELRSEYAKPAKNGKRAAPKASSASGDKAANRLRRKVVVM
ncbi:NADAR family protein [Limnohabitans sp.]|uniref:NADAR family protein n=1 Tax=Limnohabitans sp. TaxID=1907725 RepID=UPI002B001B51|nr:NADAR family protein [Limnohabitans sp.]